MFISSPYRQALVELKEKRYHNLIKLCTREIDQESGGDDSGSESRVAEARLLRASMYLLRGESDKAMHDFDTLLKMKDVSKKVWKRLFLAVGVLTGCTMCLLCRCMCLDGWCLRSWSKSHILQCAHYVQSGTFAAVCSFMFAKLIAVCSFMFATFAAVCSFMFARFAAVYSFMFARFAAVRSSSAAASSCRRAKRRKR